MTSLHTGVATTADEIRQCQELRYAANLADGRQGCFLDHQRGIVTDSLDDIATIHWIKDGSRIVGTMRSVWGGDSVPAQYADWFALHQFRDLPPEQIAFTSRLIIAPDYRKTTALQLLLDACYVSGRRKGVRIDFMHASPALIGLYERVGYRCFRHGVVETDVGHHVPMLLTADAHEWLKAIRSPFAESTSAFEASSNRDGWFRRHCAPELVDGVTPIRLGREGFLARLIDCGAHDISRPMQHQPMALLGAAVFTARDGDIISSHSHDLNNALMQLSGHSQVEVDGVTRKRYRDKAIIDAFDAPSVSARLVACSDSMFLYLPFRDAIAIETPSAAGIVDTERMPAQC